MLLKNLLAFKRYPEFVRLIWWRTFTPLFVKQLGIKLGRDVSLLGMPIVSKAPDSQILLGDRVSLCSVSEFTALGVNHAVVLRTLQPNAVLEIGEDTGISGASICAAEHVSIGKRCLIGANVIITDTDFHSINPKNRRYNNNPTDIAVSPVRIGDNVFLGVGVIVLKGVTVGDNSIIGAGSIVTSCIPANVIAAGNPAKVICMI